MSVAFTETAPAATLEIAHGGKGVRYIASAGESNRLEMTPGNEPNVDLTVTDPGASITLKGDTRRRCVKSSASTITCSSLPRRFSILARLGDRDDSATSSNFAFDGGPVRFDGGPGQDRLDGDSTDEVFLGGDGDDVLDGFKGHDVLRGGRGDDSLFSSGTLLGGPGNDKIGLPADQFTVDSNTVKGGLGNDTIHAYGGGKFAGGPGNDRIRIAAIAIDTNEFQLWSGPAPEHLSGGDGDDTINSIDRYCQDEGPCVPRPVPMADLVKCGRGRDKAILGARDTARRDCERVAAR